MLLLLMIHHSTNLVRGVAARLRRAAQGSVLLLVAASLHHVVVIVVRVLRTLHHLNRFLVLLHLVDVHLIFFQVMVQHVLGLPTMVMKVIHIVVLLVLVHLITTGPEAITCSRPRTCICRGGILLLLGSICSRSMHHCVVSWAILTAEHLVRVLINGLSSSHIHTLLVFKHSSLLLDDLLVRRVALFEALGIPERVECVITRRAARADASQHNDFDFIASQERISQDHR